MITILSPDAKKALELDFSPLDMIPIMAKVERGEATDEEKEQLRLYELKKKAAAIEERNQEEIKRMRKKAAREKKIRDAAALLKEKYCPLSGSNCLAEGCAWFKVIKTNWKDGEEYTDYKARGEYVCMCAVNIPDYRDRVVTGRDAHDI